jgi:uncharacterized membrane protein HdeD (DUF308 family)
MTRKHTMLWTATAATASALLLGWFVLQSGADQAIGAYPNNKANHHPRFGDGPTN